MPDENEKQQRLDAAVSLFTQLDLDAALKTSLGVASLGPEFRPRIQHVSDRCNTARKYVSDVNRLHVIPLADAITGFANLVGSITGTDAAVFIRERENYRTALSNNLDNIEVHGQHPASESV